MADTKVARRLGDILVQSGRISEEQLELALKEQRQTGEKLGGVLQRLGICTENEIGEILAEQAGVPHMDLAAATVQPEAAELLPAEFVRERRILPLGLHGDTLVLAMANPMDLAAIDEASTLADRYIEVVHVNESEIEAALPRFYGGGVDVDDLLQRAIEDARFALREEGRGGAGESPFMRLVDLLIQKGVDEKATDIHVEPEERVLRTRYRLDGRLVQGPSLPKELQSVVTTRLKIMASMNISETRLPQDGHILFEDEGRKVDLRVSSFPGVHGETIVSRILDKENLILGLERIGMAEPVLRAFRQDISRSHGIVLVTGPTGSGKTTTLYSALSWLNKPDVKIITLEDPVEYELPLINQGQIQAAQGFSFAAGLRAILRQDPDIILVGEIRDQETARMAIRAALTGHLVFSTLHTNDAAGAVPRLLDMGIEPFLLAATLIGVLAQRLVRAVCPDCLEERSPTPDQCEMLGLDPADGAVMAFPAGKGCPACKQTGYRGRLAVFEYLRLTEDLRRLVAAGTTREDIAAAAREAGMRTLREDALDKVREGRTSIEELLRVTS